VSGKRISVYYVCSHARSVNHGRGPSRGRDPCPGSSGGIAFGPMNSSTLFQWLPTTAREMADRGWDQADVVLVTGDAYVDHPSFGVALIGRWLEAHGYRVAVLAQPRHDRADDFRRFGRPRLFFGISAGNMDSVVANYTGNARVRDQDAYSPEGNPYFGSVRTRLQRRRPDRATIVYAQLARQAYGDSVIVLGGLEASLRRFVHYDYQQAKFRASVLTDAKADLLVFGMGERAVLEIARRLEDSRGLDDISGTCERLADARLRSRSFARPPVLLPSWQDITLDESTFLKAELEVDRHARSGSGVPLLQRQQALWVLQHPASSSLDTGEFDALHGLPFTRAPHPTAVNLPAYRMIRHSVTIVRGCSGNCSFCAITRHQGPAVSCRSVDSVVAEVMRIRAMPDFRGTVTDLGGPTANLYGTACTARAACRRRDCFFPTPCPRLDADGDAFLELLKAASSVRGVDNVFVSSGLRMELLLRTPRLLGRLMERHVPGFMKIAPEHTEAEVLRLMHKGGPGVLPAFLKETRAVMRRRRCGPRLSSYFMSAHPGCRVEHMEALASTLKALGLTPGEIQDFTPTPGTLSTAMYCTGLDRDTKRPVAVARTRSERLRQRRILEGLRPERTREERRPGSGGLRRQGKDAAGRIPSDPL